MSARHTATSTFRISRLIIGISSSRMFLRMLFQVLSSEIFWESVLVRLVEAMVEVDVEDMVDVEAIV